MPVRNKPRTEQPRRRKNANAKLKVRSSTSPRRRNRKPKETKHAALGRLEEWFRKDPLRQVDQPVWVPLVREVGDIPTCSSSRRRSPCRTKGIEVRVGCDPFLRRARHCQGSVRRFTEVAKLPRSHSCSRRSGSVLHRTASTTGSWCSPRKIDAPFVGRPDRAHRPVQEELSE